MDDCVFCKIVEDKIPSFKVYEDKDTVAFLDISQLTKGHCMVVPKTHKRWLWEHKEGEYCHIMKVARIVANTMRSYYKIEWVEMIVAGMGVPHTHVHIIPRFENDGHGEIPLMETRKKEYSKEEMKEIGQALSKAIADTNF